MLLLSYIDIYCERTAPGLWDEPLNAVTNIAFFIAAWLLYRLYSDQHREPPERGGTRQRDREDMRLIGLIALVGAGSLAFHTFANRLSMLADIIPIALFVFYYLSVALQRMLEWMPPKAFATSAALVAVMIGVGELPAAYSVNGSAPYFPCLAAILLLARRLRYFPAKWTLQRAAFLFALSLTFRSIDMEACPSLAFGTHFLWHILNGAVLYLLVKAALIYPRKPCN